MRPKAKYAVIHRHRGEYPISVMCKFFGVSRSGYYCFKKRLGETNRDAVVAKEIEECQRRTDKTYGYRRVWKWLKGRNIQRDPKTVLRIMKKYGLLSEVRRRRQWVNLGQQVHKYENLLNRQFRAVRPNEKWVTDISYIHTKEGILYLSMIRDLYDNSIVAYKTASRQTVNLVLDTIRLTMKKEKVAAELQLHSDQGFQYTSQAYFKLTQSYGITPSMSRKGNPYDNAMAENIFHRGFLYCPHNLGRFSPHRGFCRLSKKSVTAKIRCLFSITDTESHPDLDRWKPSEWVRRSAPQ